MLISILRDLRIQNAHGNVINNVRHEATKEGSSCDSWGSLSSRKRWGTWSSDSIGNPIILSVSFVDGRPLIGNQKMEPSPNQGIFMSMFQESLTASLETLHTTEPSALWPKPLTSARAVRICMTTICIDLICMPEIAKLEIMCVATHVNLLDCTPANLNCMPFHVVNDMLGNCTQALILIESASLRWTHCPQHCVIGRTLIIPQTSTLWQYTQKLFSLFCCRW